MSGNDNVFAGSIPELYERYMVPMVFEPYAQELAARVVAFASERVLEVAAGTGVLTRALARALPASAQIVATDLNPPMLERAQAIGTARQVQWQPADALDLPFPDAAFDAVVGQFGVMFYPDKPRAHAQARRVLKPGGHYLFNVWDSIAANEVTEVICDALDARYPSDPPHFMRRTPFGYHDNARLVADLAAGGFTARPEIHVVERRSHAASALDAAIALCQGTPLRGEIEARESGGLGAATEQAAQALRERFGSGAIDSRMQAKVIVIRA